MAVQRKLPDSDEKRNRALRVAKRKKDLTAPSEMALTQATQDRLDASQPQFEGKMQARDDALSVQGIATAAKDIAQKESKMFNSHFIQVFNLGVERGLFLKEHRTYYHLDINSSSLPSQNTEEEVEQVGKWLIDGDPRRIAAGGAPMGFPAIAEVSTKHTNFFNLNAAQSTAKDAFDRAQEEVAGLRDDADALILRICNEVETFYDNETIESKRRNAREWGVIYVSTRKAKITGVVTNASTGEPLLNVNVALIESEEIVQTDAEGKYTLSTDYTGAGTLEFALEGYVTQTFPVDISEGGTLTQDVSLLAV